MSAALTVMSPGPFTTVQDLGRIGHQAAGIPVSGALDPVSLRLANALVGNEVGTAALEMRLAGPTLRVEAARVRVALCGTSSPLQVLSPDSYDLPPWQSASLERGTVFRVPPLRDSVTAYLAIEGGLDLPNILGSRSTCLRAGFGGFDGRTLAEDDTLPLFRTDAAERAELRVGQPPSLTLPERIRLVPGPQDDHFTPEAMTQLFSAEYRLTKDADRMGLRLAGPALNHANGHDIASDGVASGAIQVPGDGQPIILLADHQTTGGYPKIATVISADLPALGRVGPGATLRFAKVSVEEAQSIAVDHAKDMEWMLTSIAPIRLDPLHLSSRALLSINLISGVTSGADT